MAINRLKQILKKSAYAFLACTVSWSSIAPALSCGPFYDEAIFSYSLHPDLPLQFFAEGKLGVVVPTFARSYLVVAYRYLNGASLNANERQQILNFWRFRLSSNSGDDSNASSLWLKLRTKTAAALSGLEKIDTIDKYRLAGGNEDYNPFLNCTADAFIQATRTLEDKVTKYGAGSAEVKDWLTAQDKVFCHCSTPAYDYSKKAQAAEPAFPAAAPASASDEVKRERAYQIAAANFYAKNFDLAAKEFALIAQDNASPYQKISAYLVVRALIRRATVSTVKGADQGAMLVARNKLIELIADPAMTSLKESLSALLKFVTVRLNPATTLLEVSKRLTVGADATFYDDLESYIYLLDGAFHEDSEDAATTHKVEDKNRAASMRADDMSDWIWTFSSDDSAAKEHALTIYQKSRSTAWLICLASKLKGDEAVVKEVLAALKAVRNDPAFVTASYYQARILAARHDNEAIAVSDNALKLTKAPSALNRFNLLKLNLAKSLDELVTLSYRSPALVIGEGESSYLAGEWDDDDKKKIVAYKTLAPMLRPEAAVVLNQKLPLSQFLLAAQSSSVPKNLRPDFAQAAFCRAILLHDQVATSAAIKLLRQSMPSLEPFLVNYDQAGPGSKEFSAAYLFLKNPGSRPYLTAGVARTTTFNHLDDYQDNWWDAIKPDPSAEFAGQSFIKAEELARAKSELARLNAASPAPNYLAKIVCDYACSNKSDPRVPEALHLVVRATKLGATNAKTSAASKLAFQFLHQNYKGNSWTAKTPYFY